MKKALKLALIYFIILVVGTAVGTILYSFYLNLLGFIAGKEITFLTSSELFKSFFYVLFCMLLFIIPAIAYYRIRHPGGILQFIVYVVLCLITWIVLLPLSFKFQDFCMTRFAYAEEAEYLSPDYFRHVDDNVYYFTSDFKKPYDSTSDVAEASAVVISTAENGRAEYTTVKAYDTLDVIRKAVPYKEIQLKNIFSSDSRLFNVNFNLLINKLRGTFKGGLPNIMTMFSLMLLLCSVYAITNLFDWRLLNTVTIFIVSAATLCFNSFYYFPDYSDLIQKISSWGFFRFFAGFVSEPLLFTINCFFALLFIAVGIIRLAVRKHAAKEK